MKTIIPDNVSSPFTEGWHGYYDAMAGTPPRDTLLFALARFDAEAEQGKWGGGERFAIDLGCGEGRDTVEMLRRGWRVLAIDGEEEAIRRLRMRPDLPPGAVGARLETLVCPMEEARLPPAALLINASFALPFCPPESFPALWERITASLLPNGGRISGQLFGVRDTWASVAPRMTFHTRAEVETLLRPFVIERLDESEADGTTVEGKPKRWHLFHIIARSVERAG